TRCASRTRPTRCASTSSCTARSRRTRTSARESSTSISCDRLVELHARLLHYRRPLRQLLLHEGGERLRSARHRLGALGLETLPYLGVVERLADFAIQFLYYRPRRGSRREHPIPERHRDARKTELGEGWRLGDHAVALRASGGEHAQLAAA